MTTPDVQAVTPAAEPRLAARAARLRYLDDSRPGIRRERRADRFVYLLPDGAPLDEAALARVTALRIPPAWTDVWISPLPSGHLQATGRDARGRKQYRYHPRWRAVRDEAKYERMLCFGEALPALRARVDEDLRRHALPRERVLAATVRLLDETLIRVGNEAYARDNGTYGLTTLRGDHVEVAGATIRFRFRGKSGKEHLLGVKDPRVARDVRRCLDLPGQELLQYVDGDGQPRTIESEDVNAYLRGVTGQDFTAKDFRTWGGTVAALRALTRLGPSESEARARHLLVQAVKEAAAQLGNTPAICRASYIHPAVIDAYLAGSLFACVQEGANAASASSGLRAEEACLLALLRAKGSTDG